MRFILFIACMLAAAVSYGQETTAAKEKTFFDFLLGEWRISDKVVSGQVIKGNPEELFRFEKILGGNAISSTWHFDRGTNEKPDLVDAVYYSGYDTRTSSWSFYYISDRSAQYWQGRKENGVWNFYKTFEDKGQTYIERQTWSRHDESTFFRFIARSPDDGKTWKEVYRATFERKQ